MDNYQAQKRIQELYSAPFNIEIFRHFLENFLNDYEPRENKYYKNARLWKNFWPHINYYERIGKYTDPAGNELDILVVEVPTFSKLERARSTLRNLVVKHLNTFGEKDYALVAFYAKDDNGTDWRFSFVKIEHEAYRDETGKVKNRQKFSPAKRYSYLVGVHENSHTAAKQLLPILTMDYADPHIEDIEKAFSVEKVTDEFFKQYKALFKNVAEHLKQQQHFQRPSGEETNQAVSRFAKKLLGQIVFLYFLQKKGWLGVPKESCWGHGSRSFLRDRFNKIIKEGGNYYRDFLQYLFYDALAKERKDQSDPDYYSRFECKIPFLNGGLFESDYDWRNETLDLPNDLFHNQEENKTAETATGILDVFDRYNFTIKEDEPLDKEVAVDPEMLGKVFENMLEVTERKSKGAFYTPREIVHYMCQESLIHYLDNQLNTYATSFQDFDSPQITLFGNEVRTGQLKLSKKNQDIRVPKDALETLIRKGHIVLENDERVLEEGKETDTYEFQLPQSVRDHAGSIDKALKTIKVCDPAAGSGAFLVGIMHEIINARLALAPHSGNSQSPYELKHHAIRNSLYGVDIDASAIDIARLRLWLSLIVDEENYDIIEALPNLDYKIVRGNSLIGMEIDCIRNLQAEKELAGLQEKFLQTYNEEDKKNLRNQINRKIRVILDSAGEFSGYYIDFDFRLFFSEVWSNPKKNGFDLVIGNPPYVSHDRIHKFNKKIYKKIYSSYEPFADLYCYFIEKAISILNNSGVIAFITSNSYLRADYGSNLRRFIAQNSSITRLINVEAYQLFSTAIVNTAILIAQRGNYTNKTIIVNKAFDTTLDFDSFVKHNGFYYAQGDFSGKTWRLVSPNRLRILHSIESNHQTLEELNTKIRLGIATGNNKAFVINEEKRQELLQLDPKNLDIIKPLLRGRDIQRFYYELPGLHLILTKNEINIEKDYPSIYQYFDLIGDEFKNRGAKGKHWTNLRACSFFDDFAKTKIIWIELTDRGRFALCAEEVYLLNSAYFLLPPSKYDSKYLLSILNSSIIQFYLTHTAETSGMGTSRWINNHVKDFPIAWISEGKQRFVGKICSYCIFTKQNALKLKSAFFEQLIDGLVYELYFPDEIKAAGKEILPHLGELEPLTDKMSEKEKLAVIQRQFDRLYDPNHPVRNNLETLDSVEVVRTIREALKR